MSARALLVVAALALVDGSLTGCGPHDAPPPVDAGAPVVDAAADVAFDADDGGAEAAIDAAPPPPFDGNDGICIAPGNPCGGEEAGVYGGCCDPTSYDCVDDGTATYPFTGRCAFPCCETPDGGFVLLDAGTTCDGGPVRACW